MSKDIFKFVQINMKHLLYTSIWWYLRVLPLLHRPEVVDIGVNTK